ncbi:MAG: Asp-tRNA(Asn)/Glu-tRNA(Gln) amidotransferase subunit GatC [Candidatus Curtissbacteria bacterium]|nr:Asp-tRNA(Asn)/Glu-tRNA(Gln) amidotransferase subunit GatC [Candidatus Curtissbacteria bacterium]
MKKNNHQSPITNRQSPAVLANAAGLQQSIDIEHVAKLANLNLTPEEKTLFEKQLGEVVNYISKLNEVDTDKVEPISNITGLENVARDDEAAPSLSQGDALKNAKKTHNGFFEVNAIFEEDPND